MEIISVLGKELDDTSTRKSGLSNADLPEEILIEILSRLPPKSLSRCNCVSKDWNHTLIVNAVLLRLSRSCDKHLNLGFVTLCTGLQKYTVYSFELTDANNLETTKAFTWRMGRYTELVKGKEVCLPDAVMNKYRYISNICKDIVCLLAHPSGRACLFNLKTLDFAGLPPLITKSGNLVRSWCLLGFEPIQKAFKVLRIMTISYYGSKKTCCKAATLTLGDKEWKQVDDDRVPSSVRENSPSSTRANPFCLDGVLYWVYDTEMRVTGVLTVVAFDLTTETFRDFHLPVNKIERAFCRYYLFIFLKGCPTVFSWESSEILQLTLSNHKHPNSSWSRKNLLRMFGSNCCLTGVLMH